MDAERIKELLDLFKIQEASHAVKIASSLAAIMDHIAMREYSLGYREPFPPEAAEDLINHLADTWASGGALGQASFDMSRKSDPAAFVAEYIALFGQARYQSILKTTGQQFSDALLSGQRRGLLLEESVAQYVNSIPNVATHRAQTIAQTELHTVSQFVSQKIAELFPNVLTKEWVSIIDDRTRTHLKGDFDHLIMNGQTVAVDSPFRVPHRNGSFEELRFPGDPNGTAGNTINCRCIQTYMEEPDG